MSRSVPVECCERMNSRGLSFRRATRAIVGFEPRWAATRTSSTEKHLACASATESALAATAPARIAIVASRTGARHAISEHTRRTRIELIPVRIMLSQSAG
jgi:hypothetical protein